MNRLPERLEAHCPRCSAPFVIAMASLGRKIQCPKCRQTVSIGPLEAPPAESPPTAEEFADLHSRLAQQAELIEQLRTPPTPAADIPAAAPLLDPPSGDSILRPGHTLRWLRRDAPTGGDETEGSDQQSILLHNLRAMGRRDLVLETVLDDRPGQRLAERLSAVFREAGWNVLESPPSASPQRARGLVIAAGQCPLPVAATATYMALKAAGYSISSRLDAALGPEQSILIAGSDGDSAS